MSLRMEALAGMAAVAVIGSTALVQMRWSEWLSESSS